MKKSSKIILILVAIMLILLIIIESIILKQNNNNNSNNDIAKNNNTILTEREKQIFDFLVDDSPYRYISPNDVVGAGYPEGYIFMDNGKFAYHYGEYSPYEENQKLSFRGTWKIENNKLILQVEEEEIATGGRIEFDPIGGEVLVDYTKEIRKTDNAIEYEIEKIEDYNEIRQCLKLNNNITLYELYIADDDGYIDTIREIADKGYENY